VAGDGAPISDLGVIVQSPPFRVQIWGGADAFLGRLPSHLGDVIHKLATADPFILSEQKVQHAAGRCSSAPPSRTPSGPIGRSPGPIGSDEAPVCTVLGRLVSLAAAVPIASDDDALDPRKARGRRALTRGSRNLPTAGWPVRCIRWWGDQLSATLSWLQSPG